MDKREVGIQEFVNKFESEVDREFREWVDERFRMEGEAKKRERIKGMWWILCARN